MTPKRKAKDLVQTYKKLGKDFTRGVSMEEFSKQCALICVNEVLGYMGADRGYEFWTSVKIEIENL
jgi:hypothetical protein